MSKKSEAKKKRDSAERKRDAAQKIIDDPKKSPAQKDKARNRRDEHAKTMREQGDVMRGETGREKGERTPYTGPLTEKGRAARGLPEMTEWQKANQGLLGALGGDREKFRDEFTPAIQADYMATGQTPAGWVPAASAAKQANVSPAAAAAAAAAAQKAAANAAASPYGNYPVLDLGTPSGLSDYAAQAAAQNWAGMLGFNIDPYGGLLLRPWEAGAWELGGIDPNLWNAGLLGVQPSANVGSNVSPAAAAANVSSAANDVSNVGTDQGPSYHESYMAPGGGHWDAMDRLYAAAGGDPLWGSYSNWYNRTSDTPPLQAAPAVTPTAPTTTPPVKGNPFIDPTTTAPVTPAAPTTAAAQLAAQQQALATQQAAQQAAYQQAAGLLGNGWHQGV